jgi:nitrate reductase beta subunit
MVFHLDKCIGCHTCTIACKNIWTDRKGAEYMWWNNVETKPGTGYPTQWEDQDVYKGGWELKNGEVRLRAAGKLGALANLFYNPNLPGMDDYYEPFTYRYEDLFDPVQGTDQPTARPISMVTGENMEIEAGPNWDDDLGGSSVYAKNDPNLANLSEPVRQSLFEMERLVFNYLPRICNHCLNPACVAACPSGAIYKRGEDGVVLVNQEKCRAWRMCVSACPYKKVYYNWASGKSEKCILCFPRLETGQAPACAHSCVGRIRYMGVMLYDADKISAAIHAPKERVLPSQMDLLLDPRDPEVIKAARAAGISDAWIASAQASPIYRFVKEWQIAVPLHAEFRTMAMMFYVPPLSPVSATAGDALFKPVTGNLFHAIDDARLPLQYLANLFTVGDVPRLTGIMKKQIAVRFHQRQKTVGDLDAATVERALREAGCTAAQAEQIYRLTSLPTFAERFALPPYQRESDIEALADPLSNKQESGFGFRRVPQRGY